MNIRRWSIAGLSAALLVPGLIACKQTGAESATGSSASPSASASGSAISDDPKQALLDSTKEISNGNFRFAINAGQTTGGGVVHQPSRSAQLKMAFGQPGSDLAMNLDLVYVEPETWVKIDLNGTAAKSLPGAGQVANGKYLHLDAAKAKDIKDLRFDFQQVDPAGSEALTRSVVDVKKTGEGVYTGTLDLTKATDAGLADQALIAALGPQANAIPFEARLDPQGRLNQLTIQVPATAQTKAQQLTVSYSDYGAATPPQKPAPGETQEAPAELYQLFQRHN